MAVEKKPAVKPTPAKKVAAQSEGYGDQSITALRGADRVRKRPGVIFGSDGLEGCEHSFLKFFQMPWTRHARDTVM